MSIDFKKAEELEQKYDPSMNFRMMSTTFSKIFTGILLFSLSLFHYYTAGFGILVDHWHLSIHLSGVLGLIFLLYGVNKKAHNLKVSNSILNPGGIPLYDWVLFVAIIVVALYIPLEFDTLAFRVGDPNNLDVIMGSIMVVLIIEAGRRTMGWSLPIIVVVFVLYALFGRYIPITILAHPGARWADLINHLYLTTQGIFGIPVHVIATYVFHFVLFGVIASKIGLGQLFLDIAMAMASRYTGGPAKVSVLSSAMFGMISGSSIANTVTTGVLTIPAMKKSGFKPHFAAAVEATASTGGQITPPLMGAAAFVMAEMLEIPYKSVVIAAIIPAFMHFLGVLTMVHFEAKKLGLKGVSAENIPNIWKILKYDWYLLLPIVVLLAVLFNGMTPYAAAFYGITTCIIIGFIKPGKKINLKDLWESFQLGAKYALGVGAAAALIGIIIGVVSLSGMAFRVSFLVVSWAGDIGETFNALSFGLVSVASASLFFTLVLIALTSIILGAGIPTTACYIILATIAAPVLSDYGINPIVAHFFVFYYGVLADVTPPVAVAAYAGAGIAGSDPFKTGNTAFKLANAKALVPFVFVYTPSMLLVVDNFSWQEALLATITCFIGVLVLSVALIGYLNKKINIITRFILFVAAILIMFPGINTIYGGIIALVALFFINKEEITLWIKNYNN